MEMIHKKNSKLHIYVRQDKYKGELRSHNWVGRTYIDGKQKIISSGTTDLEKATGILEKWFDDLHLNKSQRNDTSKIEDNIPKDEVKNKIVDSNQSDNTPPPTKFNLGMFEKLKKINIPKLSLGKKNAPISGSKKISKQNKFRMCRFFVTC